MRRFTQLFNELDATTRTSEKLAALRRYFSEVPPRDAAWALALLSGGKLMRAISRHRLRDWASQETGYPAWLMSECYGAVGDLSETLALLLPKNTRNESTLEQQGERETVKQADVTTLNPEMMADKKGHSLHSMVEQCVLPLPKMSEVEQGALIKQTWAELSARERFLFHKMILGNFRVGVSAKLVVRALAEVAHVDPGVMSHRLAGKWTPSEEAFVRLMSGDEGHADLARPYPFFLAYPLEQQLENLGSVEDWQAEWKWDGIRAQLIHRGGERSRDRDHQGTANCDDESVPCSPIPVPSHVLVWSRGDELITEGFPEIADIARRSPMGTVLDGEILAWENERPLPFALLQRRINRKREEPRLWDEIPIVFMAYDILEYEGSDVRSLPLVERRHLLEGLAADFVSSRHFRLSPTLSVSSWDELAEHRERAREMAAEGLMLKRRDSIYGVDRQRGQWWKWKVNPYTLDAVLIYAQFGNGKRANTFTDYTFGVWDGGELVPVAKAYSGLTDEDIMKVDSFVRRNTVDRMGPVRVVKPELVFELAFENIQESKRHKSGLAVRFPRMARWRHDKKPQDADTIDTLRSLLKHEVRNADSKK